jgi:two-component system NtrC family response regulator
MSKEVPKILVVEDDPGLRKQLRWALDGYEVLTAGDRASAMTELRRHEPPVVLQDLGLPPDPAGVEEGLRTLQEILAAAPGTKVIVVTGNGDRDSAVKSVGIGAWDFYQKPVDLEILNLLVGRAFGIHLLEEENRRLHSSQTQSLLPGVIATSPEMQKVCRTIEKVAPVDVTTLLLGESGTGKEVLARALHALSPRSEGQFVAINCAAIPENLLESELFGYEKGAFTGAHKQTKGKVELADGGTLMLDEIGDMPASLQSKLLRFLQERVVERVGGREEIPVDVRVVCATNQNLQQLIQDGRFREDLFYRISEITVNIPPLRDREGDAVILARFLLNRFATEFGRNLKGFSKDAIDAMQAHRWPGNVRELENRIKGAVVTADDAFIDSSDLGLGDLQDDSIPLNLREVRSEAERAAVSRALTVAEGNVTKTAELLGVTRPTVYDLMERHGLKGESC